MKTKLLLSALALSTAFVACQNDEVLETVGQGNAEEIVGADLVSKGLTINLNNEASTRVIVGEDGKNKWEAGKDKVGLVWYNLAASFDAEQTKTAWETIMNRNLTADNADDNTDAYRKIVNMMFIAADEQNSFTTQGNVYQGGYFAYMPYQYFKQVGPLKLDVNKEAQTEDFLKEKYNKALHISAQEFIDSKEVDAEGKLTRSFHLMPMVNAINVKATAEEAISGNDILNKMEICELQISAGDASNKAFYSTTGEIVPRYIPTVATDENGDYDEAGTIEKMENKIASVLGLDDSNLTNLLTTKINAGYKLDDKEHGLRAFALPVKAGTNVAAATIYVHVTRNNRTAGFFRINKSSKTNVNNGTVDKLIAAIKGVDSKNNAVANDLSKILRNEKGWSHLNLPVTLQICDFAPDFNNITTLAQWNDCVELYDALYPEATEPATFKIAANIDFNEGEIKTPKAGVVVPASGFDLIVSKSTTLPANLTATPTEGKTYTGVVVKPGATLTVAHDAVTGNSLDIKPEAGAIVDLTTDKSNIHLASNVEGSRVNIKVYGAKVDLGNGFEDGVNTTIAYDLKSTDKAYMINNLIATDNQTNYAKVNTIVVKNMTFDLNMTDAAGTAIDDPYTGKGQAANEVSLAEGIKEITVELAGNGTVKNGEVGTIKALGTNEKAMDMDGAANIITVEGSTLTVDATAVEGVKPALTLTADIVNKGTLNAMTDIDCVNVDNEIGTINTNVDGNHHITYTTTYTQGGTVNGSVNKKATE